ncbi:uncharacterized protein EDB91DRAFT_1254807 [Suillus paluster]|uniref:uncharacterized protein n=1 Tax=Suillus paluster TaxID=48578 RepID=UPI001B869229|nr:uncharacterized protein EDB91DRAFT_1254807 [Suillus paluster]KAG1725339.1 hypothetical protein EDB91DRAFT_1254807 [Suillus paluster]
MITKSEVFDDSESTTNVPPPYDNISTSASAAADSVKCTGKRSSSVFSFLRINQKRKTVLSRLRDIISAPDVDPSSVASTVNSCAAILPAWEFSDLLQKPNIESHSALYWEIVNYRREAFLAFLGFISRFWSFRDLPTCVSHDVSLIVAKTLFALTAG